MNWFKKFFRKDVNSIVSSFHKTIRQLDEAETFAKEEAEKAAHVIALKQSEMSEHLKESARAAAVRSKFFDLVSP